MIRALAMTALAFGLPPAAQAQAIAHLSPRTECGIAVAAFKKTTLKGYLDPLLRGAHGDDLDCGAAFRAAGITTAPQKRPFFYITRVETARDGKPRIEIHHWAGSIGEGIGFAVARGNGPWRVGEVVSHRMT